MIVYEDAQVLALAKPSGLSVQGGSGVEHALDRMLEAEALNSKKPPRLAHRLDRETSGVILAGKTRSATAALGAAFADRACEKLYLALVSGAGPTEGEIATPLVKIKTKGLDLVRPGRPGEPAMDALTRYRTLAAASDAALLEARPATGRLHQIRAHLASIGRPILGDGKYGGLFAASGAPAPRLMLHAFAIEIPHPAGGCFRVSAPLPPEFRSYLEALGLPAPPVPGRGGRERNPADGSGDTT
jgi:tRNA pseudouridine32 synthase/23S rRNA pseudouridine746 synthase